ncbi:hypothetical protein [Massilia sp. S19_KUP03_FR1]|uniref:hypothetical protein n=1 Tax=Massilia sp. S19_KUP03_FR1 TaxID=3025503 RepID=UPI002FCD70DE
MERYFSGIHEKNQFIFIGLAFVASLIPSVFMLWFVDAPDLKNGQLSILGNFFPYFVIFFIPVFETIVCQAFPALLIDIFSLNAPIRILVITLPFSLGHIVPDLPISSFVNGISGGLILGKR